MRMAVDLSQRLVERAWRRTQEATKHRRFATQLFGRR
jgi:hypothetical protein